MITKPSPNRSVRLGHFDLDTGEVIEHATVALFKSRAPNGFGKRWLAMSQDGLARLLDNRVDLGSEALMVFMLLTAEADYENKILIKQSEIASRLGMWKQNVSRAMRKLAEQRIIVEDGESYGRVKAYRLSPDYVWKGKGVDHQKALRQKLAPKRDGGIEMGDGWIKHDGGPCPVPEGTRVDVKHRDGEMYFNHAAGCGGAESFAAEEWHHSGEEGDIIAYKIVEDQ